MSVNFYAIEHYIFCLSKGEKQKPENQVYFFLTKRMKFL